MSAVSPHGSGRIASLEFADLFLANATASVAGDSPQTAKRAASCIIVSSADQRPERRVDRRPARRLGTRGPVVAPVPARWAAVPARWAEVPARWAEVAARSAAALGLGWGVGSAQLGRDTWTTPPVMVTTQ